MKKQTKAIISLALAATISVTVAGCSSKDKQPDGEYVSTSAAADESVSDETDGNAQSNDASGNTTSAAESTTKKSKKAQKVKIKPAKPYYVTNINGKKVTTTASYEKITNKKGETVTDKKGNEVTKEVTTTAPSTKKGETTTKHYEGTTTYTTRPSDYSYGREEPLDDYALTEGLAFDLLIDNYPDKWINYFYDYDPNNNGDYAYFAVFTNPDKHTITSVITVDLKTGRANERNLKTNKVTNIKVL